MESALKRMMTTTDAPVLTLRAAKDMQVELLSHYETPAFKEALKQLVEDSGDDSKKLRSGVSSLALEMVQGKVLPKYGFEASKKGIMQSVQAFVPYNSDPTVARYNAMMGYWISPEMQKSFSYEDYVQQIPAAEPPRTVVVETQLEQLKGKDKGKGKGKGKGKKGKGKVVPAEIGAVSFEGRNTRERVPNVGIHTIEMYYPQFWFRQTEMEEFDAQPDRYGPSVIGKYTKGIGQVEARYPTDDEDPISFAMSVLHRLVERMDAKGINETARYTMDKKTLPAWNSIGRLDIGTESITDRSKSMKSYCMDLFERYGNGECNVEGVDQYNACYGGQAAGLCVQSWVESDRWDGRYGVAIATDISDAHHSVLFCVGAASTATLYFPDAPLAHHSVRASCVLHRFDFCKPAGWHLMGPVTDGKYSVECYMQAIDMCYVNIKKKLNGRELFPITDYNVFHTGGGFHIIKKAFERLVRADQKGLKGSERDALTTKRLVPSTHVTKIIGPCHTVSSFLNIGSVCMSEWDNALGKVLVVFTYGSGAASTMYQLRFDDVPFFDPLPVWKMKFYENSIWMHPSKHLHQPYVDTWMKFDYTPHGRIDFDVDPHLHEQDVYYLMEIDKFGRRFYHRGGVKGAPIAKQFRLQADKDEERKMREHYPALPPKRLEDGEKADEKTQAQLWNEIEYSMTNTEEDEENEMEDLGIFRDRYEPEFLTHFVRPKDKTAETFAPDGDEHTYQIVGTFNNRSPVEMNKHNDNSWSFEVVLGDNRWEEFHIIQDNDSGKRIYPYQAKAKKDVPCIGPHDGGHDKEWFMDCRDRCTVDPMDMGTPGDKYLITFSWQKMKQLKWEKIPGMQGVFEPSKYYVVGSWTSFEPVEMEVDDDRGEGWYTLPEVQMSSLGVEFFFCRNMDMTQKIYPVPDPTGQNTYPTNFYEPVGGPDNVAAGHWVVDDSSMRSVYRISFYRDPDDAEESGLRVEWDHIDDRDPKEYPAEYFIVGDFNAWGSNGYVKMQPNPNQPEVFVAPVTVRYDKDDEEGKTSVEPFQILMHKRRDRCIHPSREDCAQVDNHSVVMDDVGIGSKCWHIGKHKSDQASKGDVFNVQLLVQQEGNAFRGKMDVSWSKEEVRRMNYIEN